MQRSLATTTLLGFSRRTFSTVGRGHKHAGFTFIAQKQLDDIKSSGLFKNERIIRSPQSNRITVGTSKAQEQKVLNFCANNYLGLSDNATLIEASKRALDTHGLGLSSVRFICGTQDIHKALERKIAEFHGKEDCILYGSAFDANGGLFETVLTEEDAVISDQLNHASIIDGIRLCKAQKHRYKHMDMKDLEEKLKQAQGNRLRMIVTDGAFSMDGEVAPLDEIARLADKYDALIMIDECHATGFLGKTGRGSYEYHNVHPDRIDVITSTLGKALGGATGGYTCGSNETIALLRQRSRPYLFSNSLVPSIVGAAIETFDMISKDSHLRDKLEVNTKRFRKGIKDAGFTIKGIDHPIVPIMLGDAKLAAQFADAMLERGIYVIGFSYPVVPMGEARIRTQISAAHTEQDIDKAINAFTEIGRSLKVIKA